MEIKKNALITFVENKKNTSPEFSPDAKIFSFPYSTIIEAEEFCRRESLEKCYIGWRNYNWIISPTNHNLKPVIELNEKGFTSFTNEKYIYTISNHQKD